MTELQAVILDIFKQFKQICDENNLTYYAIGGTCIGAVRHHGFIPWDDDLDVAMPAADYKKFQEIAETQLPAPYSLYKVEGHPHWTWNFIKLQNDNTTFFEDDALKYPDRRTGVYMDIMPLYGMPKGRVRQFAASLFSDYCQYMNRHQRFSYTKGVRQALNVVFYLLRSLYGAKGRDVDFFIKRLDEHFSKYPFDNSDKILFGWRDRFRLPRMPFDNGVLSGYQYFQSTIECPFEDTAVAIPIGYDAILRNDVGDYMIMPPLEKQVNHAAALVDLKKSYKDYRDGQ